MFSHLPAGKNKREENISLSLPAAHTAACEMAHPPAIERAEIGAGSGRKEIKDGAGAADPGMDVSSQGRTNYGMNLRGRSSMVMVDGVRLNSSAATAVSLTIDPLTSTVSK